MLREVVIELISLPSALCCSYVPITRITQHAGKPVAAIVVANNTAGPELFQMSGRSCRLSVPAVLVSLESGESLVQLLAVGPVRVDLTATAAAACGKPAMYCCLILIDLICICILYQQSSFCATHCESELSAATTVHIDMCCCW
jgi:hypothetical protein